MVYVQNIKLIHLTYSLKYLSYNKLFHYFRPDVCNVAKKVVNIVFHLEHKIESMGQHQKWKSMLFSILLKDWQVIYSSNP